MKTRLCALVTLTALHSAAQAHFIFVVPSEDDSTARVVFSEDLEPNEDVSIEKIVGLRLFARGEGK